MSTWDYDDHTGDNKLTRLRSALEAEIAWHKGEAPKYHDMEAKAKKRDWPDVASAAGLGAAIHETSASRLQSILDTMEADHG